MKFRIMTSSLLRGNSGLATLFAFLFVLNCVSVSNAFGQNPATAPKSKLSIKEDRDDQTPPSVGEMVEKQRILRQKKEYEEMLKRGDEALKLSEELEDCLLYTSPSPRDGLLSRMPSSA